MQGSRATGTRQPLGGQPTGSPRTVRPSARSQSYQQLIQQRSQQRITGSPSTGAAGRSPVGAQGRTPIGAGGRTPSGAAASSPIGAAAASPIGAAGSSPVGAAGDTPSGAAGRAPLDAAGAAPFGAGSGSGVATELSGQQRRRSTIRGSISGLSARPAGTRGSISGVTTERRRGSISGLEQHVRGRRGAITAVSTPTTGQVTTTVNSDAPSLRSTGATTGSVTATTIEPLAVGGGPGGTGRVGLSLGTATINSISHSHHSHRGPYFLGVYWGHGHHYGHHGHYGHYGHSHYHHHSSYWSPWHCHWLYSDLWCHSSSYYWPHVSFYRHSPRYRTIYYTDECDDYYYDDSTTIIVVESEVDDDDRSHLSDAELAFCQGWVQLTLGDYETSGIAFERAAEASPGHGLVHLFLGVTFAANAEYPLAAAAFEEAYRLDPTLVVYGWDPVKHFGTQQRYNDLLATLTQYREATPTQADGWLVTAWLELLARPGDDDDLSPVKRAAGELVLYGHSSPLALAILDEVSRREQKQPLPADFPVSLRTDAWLLDPSCDGVTGLGL